MKTILRPEDKRNFARYCCDSDCEVVLPSGTYTGKVIDYSDGAGVVIDDIPDAEQGMEVTVKIFDLNLEFEGVIAWTYKASDNLRMGIRRLVNLKGDLHYFRLADILIGINRSAKTGTLEIKSGLVNKRIFIDKGDMIFATTNNEDERLGEYLLKKGKITLQEYEKATSLLKKTGERMGKILVELGSMTPKELFGGVQQHIENTIISLFPLETGEFEFHEGPIPSDEAITLQISTANIVYHGMKQIDNFIFIKHMCPSSEDILNPSQNPLLLYQSINLDEVDKEILARVNGAYPLKTLVSMSPSSDFDTLRVISAFMTLGLIHVKKDDEAPQEIPVDDIFGEPEAAPPDYLDKIEEVYSKRDHLNYYEFLGVDKSSSLDNIKQSYSHLLRQFHPDKHFSFTSYGIKEKLLEIVNRATTAFETLSDPDRRMEYNKILFRAHSDLIEAEELPPMPEEPEGFELSDTVDGMISIEVLPPGAYEKETADGEPEYGFTTDLNKTESPEAGHFNEKTMDLVEEGKDRSEEDSFSGVKADATLEVLSSEGEDKELDELPGFREGAMDGTALSGETFSPGTNEGAAAEEDDKDAGLSVYMIAPETALSRGKLTYVPVLLIVVIILAIAIPIMNSNFIGSNDKLSSNMKYEIHPPSFREEAFSQMEIDNSTRP